MKGILLDNWSNFKYENPEHRKILGRRLSEFLAGPSTLECRRAVAKIQEFGTAQDFPTSILPVLEKYRLTTPYDMGWQQVFKVDDYSTSKRSGFTISKVHSGLTFDKIPIGGKLEVKKLWGDREYIYFDYYGGALGWHQSLFDNEEWVTIEDNAIFMRNAAYLKQAQVFYALIEAVGATGAVAWQNPVPATLANTVETYSANRDIRTFNAAALQIYKATEARGYAISPQGVSFIVLAPLELMDRVKSALSLQLQAFSGSTGFANFGFRPLFTNMLVDKTHAWVILPGFEMKAGIRMDLRFYESFDMLSYTAAGAGWMAYGGAIGNTDQVARIAFA